jgi:heme exporter protein D
MHDFFNMGGYAAYVWSAYGISLAVLVMNIVLPIRRERRLRLALKKKLQREEAKHESKTA